MPGKPKAALKGLSEREHQVMEILWALGSGTAERIRETLAPHHAVKDSTVRTILLRMEKKGYVTHRIEGKAFVYSGVEKPRHVAVRAVGQILDRFCNGSLEQLLVGMVENEVIDRAELQQLTKKLAQLPKTKEK